MSRSTPVPNWLLALLVVGFVGLAVTLSFTLGRVTAPAPETGPPTPLAAAVPTSAPQAAAPADPVPADKAGPAAAPAAAPPPSASPPAAAPASEAPASKAAPADSGVAEIRAYFKAYDAASAGTMDWNNNEAFANQLVQEAMSGSTTTLDQLVTELETVRQRTAAISPPPSCAEHHSKALSVLSESRSIFGQFRNSMASGDIGAIMAIAPRMQAIEGQAKQLERIEIRLRQQAGID